MAIPNVATLYQQIGSGAEGGHEFARFIKLLLIAEYKSLGLHFISESDASGDFKKVDGYIPGDDDFPTFIKAFQYKFYPAKLTTKQKGEIIKSIKSAIRENEFIQEFIIVTPEDWRKEELKWFDKIKVRFEKSYWVDNGDITRKGKLVLSHWGHSKIIETSLKHDHIGNKYFSSLFPLGVGKFKLSKASIDTKHCAWSGYESNATAFYLDTWRNQLTSEPVFDFQFKNSSAEIALLNKIEIHIEEIWTVLKGIPQRELLKSIGTISIPMDFAKAINTFQFHDPLIFNSKKAKRFKIQLQNFKNCPGNWVRLKFWFHFDDFSVPTDSFSLGL
jgi:hypothetical protein